MMLPMHTTCSDSKFKVPEKHTLRHPCVFREHALSKDSPLDKPILYVYVCACVQALLRERERAYTGLIGFCGDYCDYTQQISCQLFQLFSKLPRGFKHLILTLWGLGDWNMWVPLKN